MPEPVIDLAAEAKRKEDLRLRIQERDRVERIRDALSRYATADGHQVRKGATWILNNAIHAYWPKDVAFTDAAVQWVSLPNSETPMAYIDWEAAADLADHHPGSSGQIRLLRFCCSLAGAAPRTIDIRWGLADMITSFDEPTARYAADGLQYAMTGTWRERD